MERLVWLNGELVPQSEAKISVLDHGVLYGDGVFEGIRAYNGRVFRLEEHLKRLFSSAKTIGLDIPLSAEELSRAVCETVRANGLRDAYIRLVVTRGVGDLGLDPRKCHKPTVFVIVDELALYPDEFYENGLELITVSTRRNSPTALNPAIKSLNYLNNILAKIEVNRAGLHEGLMLSHDGHVAECTGDNIFMVCGEEVITPPVTAGILEGITRNVVMELAAGEGYRVTEKLFFLHDLYNADEVFLTGTAAEIVPVVKVDGRTIGEGKPGPVTRKLRQAFRALTETEGTPIGEAEQVMR